VPLKFAIFYVSIGAVDKKEKEKAVQIQLRTGYDCTRAWRNAPGRTGLTFFAYAVKRFAIRPCALGGSIQVEEMKCRVVVV
jgi:hypothetical protein